MPNKTQERHVNVTLLKDRLKDLLTDREKTQKEVAGAIKRDARSFGHYVSGQTVPDLDVLFKLSKYFKISSDYLIGLSADSGKKNFYEIPKSEMSLLVPCYNLFKEKLYETIVNPLLANQFTNKSVIQIKLNSTNYEPQFKMNSIVNVDSGLTRINSSGVYVFEIADGYMMRRVETIDFSNKAKVYKFDGTNDYVEIDLDQDVVGKVKSTIQPV